MLWYILPLFLSFGGTSVQLYILFNTFLVMLGSFLNWIEPKIFVVALRGIEMMDGKLVFGFGLVGFIGVAYELICKKKQLNWLYGVLGLAVTVISGVVFFNYYQNNYNAGPGIYVSTLGGIQLVGSYVVLLLQPQKE